MSGKSKSPKQGKGDAPWQEKVFFDPWPYWVGGVSLAIINIIYTVVTGEYWSITMGFTRWGVWLVERAGVDAKGWAIWEYDGYLHPLQERATWSNLGMILGALIAVLLARQFKWKQIKNKKQILLALGGGWLMGYGARVASGCNIGGLYSAISSLALNGWLFLPGIFLGVWVGSKVLYRYFL